MRLRGRIDALLGGLRGALDAGPGDERLLVVAYYAPVPGLNGLSQEALDLGLRGAADASTRPPTGTTGA